MRPLKIILNVAVGIIIFFAVAWGCLQLGNSINKQIIETIDRAGILLGYLLACLTSATGIVALANSRAILRIITRLRGGYVNTGHEFQIPVEQIQAMVIPVSRRIQPEWIIRQLQPKQVSFIYTEDRKNEALALATEYSRPSDGFEHVVKFFPAAEDIANGVDMVRDPDNPIKSKLLTKKYLRRFLREGIGRHAIFVDTTGGKVPMSIGCFQAAEEMRISSIYIKGTSKKGWIRSPLRREDGDPVYISDLSI